MTRIAYIVMCAPRANYKWRTTFLTVLGPLVLLGLLLLLGFYLPEPLRRLLTEAAALLEVKP